MSVAVAIACLCVAGIYVSSYMLRKQIRGDHGELREASVVLTPRAKATGVPNSLLGLVFYVAILLLTPFLSSATVWVLALIAAALASALSLYLAYSLLFVTRMPCAYCWAGHIINWLLLALLIVARR